MTTESQITTKDAIRQAGGPVAVARHFDVTHQAVWKWQRYGIPRTDWTGDTEYRQGICALAAKRGYYIDLERVEWRPA